MNSYPTEKAHKEAYESWKAAEEAKAADGRGAPTASGLSTEERLRIYETIDRLITLLENDA